ncbi:MAG: 1-deoxy-D-xylulose-5-phosphate synthase [Firmicutes bacterium]|nr:1-deoxy-D-xylulose-5-phosphate synthase [Bacillota bacterium]
MSLLHQIKSPEDLKALGNSELATLATELRQEIIAGVAITGGHLGSNLGVVELTVALHREFSTPKDCIVWDVGHQTYAHKLLTGRQEQFLTLRQEGGLSGFPKRSESRHDAFDTGHSTTSISAALGLAEAARLQGSNNHVVAVIGDGALTGGMAWEAINHAAELNRPLLVVLNDNEMSIAPNVGSIAKYLTTLRTLPFYQRTKKDVQGLLRGIPRFGSLLSSLALRVKSSMKYLLVRGMVFEELGFTYLGPVDGHSISDLRAALRQAKTLETPVLLHCVTKKGKGYLPAEINPEQFHGVPPFDQATGERNGHGAHTTFTELFGENICSLAAVDSRIVAITAAMRGGTGLSKFAKTLPRRLYDVGIAEQHAVTFAAGLAAGGIKPVVAVYSSFLQRAYDQLLHDVCLQKLPVVFCLDRAGVVGEDGETHHGIYDLSYLRTLPGMKIFAPVGKDDFGFLLAEALKQPGPVAVRYPRDEARHLGLKPSSLLGQCIGDREPEVLLVGVGPLLGECLEAAKVLRANGFLVGVYYAPQIWPLPLPLLELVSRTPLVVTVEDNILSGGFGSSLEESLERVGGTGRAKIIRLGYKDGFVAQASRARQLALAGLNAPQIVTLVEMHVN